jgi:hypothetical protein
MIYGITYICYGIHNWHLFQPNNFLLSRSWQLKSDFQESTSEPNTLLNVVDSLENYDIKLSTEKNCFILDFISTLDNIIKLKTVW